MVTDPVTQYAERVVEGKIPSCRLHRLSCERHLRDLERGRWVWNWEDGKHAVDFIQLLRHHKGRQFAGKRLLLEPWQVFFIGSVFGWKRADGHRRFKESYLEVPRKNGKTTLAAGVALYGLFGDGEPGAEIYSVATKRDQAAICFNDGKAMRANTPVLRKRSRAYQTALVFPKMGNSFKPLSSDSKTMDGLNPHIVIGDEGHAWEDRNVYNKIAEGFGSRVQPLFFHITTAGENIDGICYELRSHLIALLEGNEDGSYEAETFFGSIFTVDDEEQWMDEGEWLKANPNLGVSKDTEDLKEKASKAQQIPSLENPFKNYQLNIWTTSGEKWLDMDAWKRCNGEVDLEVLKGQPCHLGIDLSTIQDITAVVAVFPPGPYPEWTIYPRLFIPEDNMHLKSREDKKPYDVWHKQGFLQTTPGNVIDLEYIFQDVLWCRDTFNVISAGFDPWKGVEIARWGMEEGIDMVVIPQNFANLSAPSLKLEALVLREQIRHGGHPVLRWMAGNAIVKRDGNGNIKPDKESNKRRIDGISGTIMGIARCLTQEDKSSVYEKRGAIEG